MEFETSTLTTEFRLLFSSNKVCKRFIKPDISMHSQFGWLFLSLHLCTCFTSFNKKSRKLTKGRSNIESNKLIRCSFECHPLKELAMLKLNLSSEAHCYHRSIEPLVFSFSRTAIPFVKCRCRENNDAYQTAIFERHPPFLWISMLSLPLSDSLLHFHSAISICIQYSFKAKVILQSRNSFIVDVK